jgi:hypothetical protein
VINDDEYLHDVPLVQQVIVFVWIFTKDLSGMGDPIQHGSQDH